MSTGKRTVLRDTDEATSDALLANGRSLFRSSDTPDTLPASVQEAAGAEVFSDGGDGAAASGETPMPHPEDQLELAQLRPCTVEVPRHPCDGPAGQSLTIPAPPDWRPVDGIDALRRSTLRLLTRIAPPAPTGGDMDRILAELYVGQAVLMRNAAAALDRLDRPAGQLPAASAEAQSLHSEAAQMLQLACELDRQTVEPRLAPHPDAAQAS
jgi:hypothetical protein